MTIKTAMEIIILSLKRIGKIQNIRTANITMKCHSLKSEETYKGWELNFRENKVKTLNIRKKLELHRTKRMEK